MQRPCLIKRIVKFGVLFTNNGSPYRNVLRPAYRDRRAVQRQELAALDVSQLNCLGSYINAGVSTIVRANKQVIETHKTRLHVHT